MGWIIAFNILAVMGVVAWLANWLHNLEDDIRLLKFPFLKDEQSDFWGRK